MAAPARTRPAKKVVAAKTPTPFIIQDTRLVDVTELRVYHENPNVGDIDEIAISLNENGMYRPIVVNIGTLTGRKNEILAGNHTYLGARKEVRYDGPDGKERVKEAWTQIHASFVDVDEDTAKAIVLADNETAAKAKRNETIVARILASIPEVRRIGTGFTRIETDDLVSRAMKDAEEALASAERIRQQQKEEDDRIAKAKTFSGAPLGEEPDGSWEDDDESDGDNSVVERNLEKASDELVGAYELKEELPDIPANRVGYWGIPKLRTDMFMTPDEIPDGLEAWAGSASKDDDDPDRWWLYNWGVDSTSGMKDVSKVIVSFYTWDEYFENWFWHTKKYVTKCLNSGIKYILTPDYSLWSEQAQILNLYAVYKARYVGRYCQEAGLKLVPSIGWPMGDTEFLTKHVLSTLPKNIPLIAFQLQTWDEKEVAKIEASLREGFETVINTLNPEGILLYAGKPGYDWFRKNVKFKGEIFRVTPRVAKLADAAKKREKKTTI